MNKSRVHRFSISLPLSAYGRSESPDALLSEEEHKARIRLEPARKANCILDRVLRIKRKQVQSVLSEDRPVSLLKYA